MAGLGLDTGQYSPHTHITLSTLPPFVTLLYGIYQQYLHISHSIISLSSSHTRTQRDKQVSIRQQVIFCISYITASRHCSSDMMGSTAVRGSGRVIIVITIIISVSAAGRVSDCRQWNSRVACIISSSHHQHYPQQSASSRLPRVGVTIVTIVSHNSNNSHNSHNTLVTNTPRLGRGCRLLTAEEERWPALMRTEQRPQEEGNYCSGGEAVSVSPSYPIGPLHYTLLCPLLVPCIIHC